MTKWVDEIATSSNQKTVRLLAMTGRVDEILTSHNTLLRMTKWVVEIATSSNQRTVELLTRTDLGNYFHPYLVTKNETRVYLENPWA
jgi:thiamine pyrophosphokinase